MYNYVVLCKLVLVLTDLLCLTFENIKAGINERLHTINNLEYTKL